MSRTVSVRYDPRLIEEAVFLAQRSAPQKRELREQREHIYEVPDPDERERRFGELNHFWFTQLELDKPVDQALGEQPSIPSKVGSCFVVCAAQTKEQGAELFVAPDEALAAHERRTLRILLRPESLLDAQPLLTFLRHELFHIADMLDPDFAYEPALPKAEGGPTCDTLVTNRYRVLWDVTINARMARRGWIAESVRAEQLADFHGAFPMLKENAEDHFNRFFGTDQPSHPALAIFAFDPRAAVGSLYGAATPGTRCPLCRFPSHAFEAEPVNLGHAVIAAINQDFPQWTPALGLCAQCADLYRANQLSLEAARMLPGWTPSPTYE